MADNFIQVAPDSTGKKLQTFENPIGADNVQAEAVVICTSAGVPITDTNLALDVNVTTATLPTDAATATHQTDGTQKTQIVDTSQNVAEVIGNALHVYLPTVAATQSGNWNVNSSGTVNVNAGTNLNTSLLATSANLTAGTQKTQICDPTNASNVAGTTSGALNVYLANIAAISTLNTANVSVRILQGAATLASGQIIIGNISTTIAGSRPTRRSATIRNQDSANSGYIGPAPIGTGNGLLLYPGDSVSVDFVGVIAGISLNTTNAGNVTFGYLETYD